MSLLSKLSYYKIQWLATKVEIRCCLNALGFYPDLKTEERNKQDLLEAAKLSLVLDKKDIDKILKYIEKRQRKYYGGKFDD